MNKKTLTKSVAAPILAVTFLASCNNGKDCSLLLKLKNCTAFNVKNTYKERENVTFQIIADDGYTLPDITKVETIGISHPFSYELNTKETIAELSFTMYENAMISVKSIEDDPIPPAPRPGVYHTARFLSYTGDVLQTVRVEEGKNPVYSGPTPTRTPDIDVTYTFMNWTPYELPTYLPKPITEDTDFRPEFIKETRLYNCKMTGENCKVNGSYSQTVAFPYNATGNYYINVDENTKYKLPDTIEVKRNGQTLLPGSDYEYSKASTSAHLILKILGETEIKVVAVPK